MVDVNLDWVRQELKNQDIRLSEEEIGIIRDQLAKTKTELVQIRPVHTEGVEPVYRLSPPGVPTADRPGRDTQDEK
ncbi:MAG: hypothetical protein FJX78_04520 [Armatimonadetes bacterium]|nr:hypothetical protein [Armatimonadota bacterium]